MTIAVFLDGRRREIQVFGRMTGSALYSIFCVKPNHGLFVEHATSDEELFRDSDEVTVSAGDKFFTVPPAMGGGLSTNWGTRGNR